jgi:two-component system, OmpR family, sensor histidine kinase BaeS
MKIRIQYRLFLAMVAASGLTVICMVLIMQWRISSGFLSFVNTIEKERSQRLAEKLTQAFAKQGSWDFIRDVPPERVGIMLRRFTDGEVGSGPEDWPTQGPERRPEEGLPPWPFREPGEEPGMPPRPDLILAHRDRLFEARVFLLDGNRRPVFGSPEASSEESLTVLQHQERIVGYLGLLKRTQLSNIQLRFVQTLTLALALTACAILVLSAVISFPFARRLVRPLKALAAATLRLASGDYSIRVPAASSDEIGQLSRDFNVLAMTLEKNEHTRRQWVADISHELRTPIAVLHAEIEAIQDGVRQATPEAIGLLHAEVLRLGRLVDDLYQLSLSDLGALSYRKAKIDLNEILEESLALFRPEFARKGIEIASRLPAQTPTWVFSDPERLGQLFANLLDNSLKYTDAAGCLEVFAEVDKNEAKIHLRDSVPGVPEGDLPRLFERLYRVEGSRSRATGGAGLGLAIARNIAEAHEGSITAQPSPLGGLWITVTLPVMGEA